MNDDERDKLNESPLRNISVNLNTFLEKLSNFKTSVYGDYFLKMLTIKLNDIPYNTETYFLNTISLFEDILYFRETMLDAYIHYSFIQAGYMKKLLLFDLFFVKWEGDFDLEDVQLPNIFEDEEKITGKIKKYFIYKLKEEITLNDNITKQIYLQDKELFYKLKNDVDGFLYYSPDTYLKIDKLKEYFKGKKEIMMKDVFYNINKFDVIIALPLIYRIDVRDGQVIFEIPEYYNYITKFYDNIDSLDYALEDLYKTKFIIVVDPLIYKFAKGYVKEYKEYVESMLNKQNVVISCEELTKFLGLKQDEFLNKWKDIRQIIIKHLINKYPFLVLPLTGYNFNIIKNYLKEAKSILLKTNISPQDAENIIIKCSKAVEFALNLLYYYVYSTNVDKLTMGQLLSSLRKYITDFFGEDIYTDLEYILSKRNETVHNPINEVIVNDATKVYLRSDLFVRLLENFMKTPKF